jgi:UDP-N-acetylglucosamine acyltransferase
VIDPHAVISPRAELASDVTVGPFSVIGPGVSIGPRTVVGPHVVINGSTAIGADNRIFQFASIGDAPQDKKYRGEPTRLEIGERNVFRESCTVNRGTARDHGLTRIGNDNLFMAYSHVAHDCIVGSNAVFANCAALGGHVQIGDWVILGGLTAVHQFTKIGAHAFLAGGAIVTRDVPPYVMVAGNPAVPHAVNTEGLKRRGFDAGQIRGIRHAYRVLYRSELKLTEALERLDALGADRPEVRVFVDFIRGSERSIVR